VLGADAARAVMLAARIAELEGRAAPGPHAPPASVPPYARPPAPKRRRKKPGARDGHDGHRRPTPAPDRVEEVAPITTCPECHGPVCAPRRRRTVEDLPPDLKSEAVVIPRHWCPTCKRHVEPRLAAALPGAAVGHGVVALTSVFHYGLGLTIDQVRQVLRSPLRTAPRHAARRGSSGSTGD